MGRVYWEGGRIYISGEFGSTFKKVTDWHLGKEGGWEKYYDITENRNFDNLLKVIDDETIKIDEVLEKFEKP